MKAVVLRVNGESENILPKNGRVFSLREVQKVVGGLVEVVRLSKSKIMLVNEEGAINGMKVNDVASLAYTITYGRMQPIYGDVLICGTELFK